MTRNEITELARRLIIETVDAEIDYTAEHCDNDPLTMRDFIADARNVLDRIDAEIAGVGDGTMFIDDDWRAETWR